MRDIRFHCIITGNHGEVIKEYHEWFGGDGWKHDYYSPLVTNGVFSHEELGDGWMGEITRRESTGLTDKNGTEIYEGDIVKRMDAVYIYSEIDDGDAADMEYKEEVSTIVYSHHGFWVKGEDFGWEGEGLWDWDNIEVIGNVHQNPELLTKKTA